MQARFKEAVVQCSPREYPSEAMVVTEQWDSVL